MEIKVEGKNKKYAELIRKNYSGKYSDLTTFLFYKYQSNYFFNQDSYYASNMNKLSNDSLDHLDIFGKFITLLGEKPNYNDFLINDQIFVENKEQLIEIGIRLTKEKIIEYTNNLNLIEDEYIKEVLTNFIIEERKNLEILEILQLKYKREKLW